MLKMPIDAKFVDIMQPRWAETSIFPFMTRTWSPQKTMNLEKTYSPQQLKNFTAYSVYMDAIIDAECAATGTSKEKLKSQVLKYLDEMGLDKKMFVVRWMGVVFLKVSFMMKIGVYVNESAILNFKSSMGKNPVLFLPTHRSYADFCLMTYLCYHYDIDLPAVAAGIDFYSMAVVGRSMRDTCAFYIRRTLAGAPLYAATLRQYVRTLVTHHAAPLEFFIEGTRSRANKSLPPKYGMLSMALLPLFAGEVNDVTILPINISYDRLIEHGLFAYEQLGVPKPKESTGSLLKSMYRLNDHFGNIYINVGEPMQVKEYLENSLTPNSELLKPVAMQQVTSQQFTVIQDIANDVVASQQECTVVTITNLLSMVLMQSILRNTPLSYEEVIEEIQWTIETLRHLGAHVFVNDVRASLEKILIVHKEMVKFETGKLRLVSSALMNISEEVKAKMKGHTLAAESMVTAVPLLQLQLYVNPTLHRLVPSALLALLSARGRSLRDQLISDYHNIRRLLYHEFFYVDKNEDSMLNKAIEYCLENDVIRQSEDSYVVGGNLKLTFLLSAAITPALASLRNCAKVLLEYGSCSHRQALRLSQARAEASRGHPYCLSLEAIAAGLRGLALAGAAETTKSPDQKEVQYTVTPKMQEHLALIKSITPEQTVDFGRGNAVILDKRLPARL